MYYLYLYYLVSKITSWRQHQRLNDLGFRAQGFGLLGFRAIMFSVAFMAYGFSFRPLLGTEKAPSELALPLGQDVVKLHNSQTPTVPNTNVEADMISLSKPTAVFVGPLLGVHVRLGVSTLQKCCSLHCVGCDD